MAISDMTLAEKIRYLREVEGSLREMGRPMTQLELVKSIRKEQGKSISQSYISQIGFGTIRGRRRGGRRSDQSRAAEGHA
jgi:hypothetical protein